MWRRRVARPPTPVLAAALVVALTLPAIVPLLRPGYWRSDDGLIHLFRLAGLRHAVAAGGWYPRLFPEFAFDYGFAVFHYYAPLSYYVGLFFTAAGLSTVAAMKATFALSLVIAALTMWWLARDVWNGEWAGILAAVVYTYLPYHLADVYVRGALAESWAFVWWPLVLWAVWRGRWGTCALGLAALVLTHNLSALLFAPLLAVWWGVVTWTRQPEGNTAAHWLAAGARLAGAAALGALLSAFYWLPVLSETRWVLLAADVGGRGFVRHLYPWREWIARTFVYRYVPDQQTAAEHPLSWGHLALLAVILWAAWRARSRPRVRWLAGPLVGLLAVILFLLTDTSLPVWNLIAVPFGMVQYPWRWLGIVVLLTALLSGAVFQVVRGRQAQVAFVAGVAFLLGFTGLRNLPVEPLTPDLSQYPEVMWAEDFRLQQIGATWTAEYLPRWVREERWAVPRSVERPEVSRVVAVEEARLVDASPWRYVLDVKLTSPAALRLHQFYLPAWRAWLDGQPVPTWPSTSLGLVTVNVPAGRHRVAFAWRPTAPVVAGDMLAVVGVAVGLGWGLWNRRRWPGVPRSRRLAVLAVVAVLLGAAGGGVLVKRNAGAPARFSPTSVAVGDLAWLVGWERVPEAPRSGQALSVTLYWFSQRSTPANYKVFVHLTKPDDGRPLVQSDADAGSGYTPTTRWVPGELVLDRHRLVLPANLPPGEYHLWAGLYDFTTGERLPVAGRSDGRIFLGRVWVQPPGKE